MARTFTLVTLVGRAKQRCDMEGQELISDSEWKGYISTAYADLVGTVAETGLRHFEDTEDYTGDGTADYALPADHLSTIAVDFVNGTQRRELFELMAQERNMYAGVTGEAQAYAVIGSNLYLYPTPASGTYRLTYVPQPTDLSSSADATAVDVVSPDGEAFLLWHVAVQALAKEGSDTSLARQEREEARIRLANWASLRSLHSSRRRVVSEGPGFTDPADYWGREGF